MDALDRAIIELLQREGRLSNQDLAARVGLTPAPCLRRVRRLEADGVITGYSAVVDPVALGRGFEVIIHADLVAKDLATVEAFEERVAAMEEVAELRRMFGIPDYLLRVQVSDLRNRLRIMPVNWHFRNRLVPKSDEVRSGPTPYRRAGRIHHQVHHRRD